MSNLEQTLSIIKPDARLLLADALTFTEKKYKPELIVD